MLVIVVRAIASWLPPRARANELYEFVRSITEPVLRPVRRALPLGRGIDLSPLIVLLALDVLARAIAGL